MRKIPAAVVAVLSCSAVFLSSCVYEMPVYRGGTAYSYSSAAPVWTEASYDANGFPIFGYYGGRPVYGYTAEGVAIFTFAALTAACLVPLWAPAPWYHGHWHYPHHIHRVSVPPRCPHDHRPAMRPHGGLNAPIHKHPQQVLHAPHHNAPQMGHNMPQHRNAPQMGHNMPQHRNAPQVGHNMPQQHHNAPQVRHEVQKHHAAPQMSSPFSPAPGQQGPVINRQEQSRHQVQVNRHDNNRGPQQSVMNASPSVPQMNRHESAVSHHRQQGASPMMQAAAPSAPAVHAAPAPSAPAVGNFNRGGHSNTSFGGGAGHGHHGGHRR